MNEPKQVYINYSVFCTAYYFNQTFMLTQPLLKYKKNIFKLLPPPYSQKVNVEER